MLAMIHRRAVISEVRDRYIKAAIKGNFINAGLEDRTIKLNVDEIKKIKNKIAINFKIVNIFH